MAVSCINSYQKKNLTFLLVTFLVLDPSCYCVFFWFAHLLNKNGMLLISNRGFEIYKYISH